MIKPALLLVLFNKSYDQIMAYTDAISHETSIQAPSWGGNSMHWILGHVVVSRCNFLHLIDVSSIWDWETCKLFIPGSSPTPVSNKHIDFPILRDDLRRTQKQLIAALEHQNEAQMGVLQSEIAIGQHLAEYAVHESYHAGQLEILQRELLK